MLHKHDAPHAAGPLAPTLAHLHELGQNVFARAAGSIVEVDNNLEKKGIVDEDRKGEGANSRDIILPAPYVFAAYVKAAV
jgi:hypothetical protein